MRSKAIAACLFCGTEFRPFASNVARGGGKYCSRECMGKARSATSSLAERFWEKVKRTDDLLSCWEWTGYRRQDEYGHDYGLIQVPRARGQYLRAHVFSWELHFGAVPEGMFVLHACDNPPCVRPDHLFLGDHQANMEDMAAKGRASWGERSSWAKLTEAKVLLARTLHDQGISFTEIGRRLNVSGSTISRAVRGKTWTRL